jgi:hypothetical protein
VALPEPDRCSFQAPTVPGLRRRQVERVVGFGAKQARPSGERQRAVRLDDLSAQAQRLVHLDARLWKDVIAGLPPGHRCLAPTLPLGAPRRVMKPSANLSLPGMARPVGEFLDRLGLADVTLVRQRHRRRDHPDAHQRRPWVGPVVIASCEAFGNFPPGLTATTLVLAGELPPTLFGLVIRQMRVQPLRRRRNAFGWLTKRGDAAAARGWNRSSPSAASVATRSACAAPPKDSRLPEPALIVLAKGDRVMPPKHGRRLTGLLPQAAMFEIDDSYTLIPLDQPARPAQLIADFTRAPRYATGTQ